MKLRTEILPIFFEIGNSHNSHYTKSTNTYDFKSRGSRILCVTIGESWTWGSDLIGERLENVYGNQLSEMFDADWLNLSLPGVGNHFIASKVSELNSIADRLEYDKIFVFCTFTEIGRQLDSKYDRHIDFLDWKNKQTKIDFDDFLLMLNRDCLDIIQKNSKKLHVTIGTNFVESLGFSGRSWLSLLIDYQDTCYACMHGLDNLVSKKIPILLSISETDQFKEWCIDMINKGRRRNRLLATGINFVNLHPSTREQHKIWAQELFNRI
jgi:hypothetical protein